MRLPATHPGIHILVAMFIALGALSLGAYSSGQLSGTLSILLSLSSVSIIGGCAALIRISHSRRQPALQSIERERHDDRSRR